MRILVTGHHGYIGSVVAPMLQDAGHDVAGLDTFYYRNCDFGRSAELEPARDLDLRDVLATDLEGFEAVVHLAALSNDPLGDLNPDLTHAVNLVGTVALARAASEAGVRRFIFASSCSIYGAADGETSLDEEAALRPLTPYAESKVAAEEALRELSNADFAAVSMRNATAYGVSSRLRLDVVLNNLVAWAHTTGAIRLESDGTSWRPLVHVRDIGLATIALLDAPAALVSGEAFNIGSASQNYRIRDLADAVQKSLPSCDITFSADAVTDPRSYRVDFSKFEAAFPDCQFQWTAERGVAELVSAFQTVGLTYADFDHHRYIRLRMLKRLLDEGALSDDLLWTTPVGHSQTRSPRVPS